MTMAISHGNCFFCGSHAETPPREGFPPHQFCIKCKEKLEEKEGVLIWDTSKPIRWRCPKCDQLCELNPKIKFESEWMKKLDWYPGCLCLSCQGQVLGDEKVHHPNHYGGDTTYETIKVIEAWSLDFCLGSVLKYISRAGKKPGESKLNDLKKARWYIDRAIQAEELVFVEN